MQAGFAARGLGIGLNRSEISGGTLIGKIISLLCPFQVLFSSQSPSEIIFRFKPSFHIEQFDILFGALPFSGGQLRPPKL